jgi:hypothetical protein
MYIRIRLPISIDCYMTENGINLSFEDEEEFEVRTFTFKDLLGEFLESNLVPTDPPSMKEEDRQLIKNLVDSLMNSANYLKERANDVPRWEEKNNSMGYRN